MTEYVSGTSREQLQLIYETIDDLISEDNPVRFIDSYVDSLDLHKLEFKIPKLKTGRNPYNPELLLKIYIYRTSENPGRELVG